MVGLGSDALEEVADGELGGAKEGGVPGGNQGPSNLEKIAVGGLSDGLSQLLGFNFQVGGKGFLQGGLTECGGGLLLKRAHFYFGYKDSANFGDAHTGSSRVPLLACEGLREPPQCRHSRESPLGEIARPNTEVFLDEGDVDMLQAMKTYRAVGCDGPFVSDHTPRVEGDTSWGHRGRTYSHGYMRPLVQAANAR